MAVPSVIQLQCGCNSYPWGKQGSKSLAATLCAKTPGWTGKGPSEKFSIDESQPYAEMWMGTYPELPSYVLSTGQDLQELIDKNKDTLVGDGVLQKFGHSKIPFLPKILSIAKALPLQLHPNKELAAKLHKEDPSNFTDPNHKPEIALALSDFEAFCGFKPLEDIHALLQLEPLKQYLPNSSDKFNNNDLKEVVRAMLKADESSVKKTVEALQKLPDSSFGSDTHIKPLIPRLVEQYEETDNGILVALITMNFLKLKPGEVISIPADGIHAYLYGDIVECMARSNNVLNTGFCPRAERNSVDLFCSCLTFAPHSIAECRLPPKPYHGGKNGKTEIFTPPMNEFNILSTKIKAGEKEIINPIDGPSIAIATSGNGTLSSNGEEFAVKEGSIWFIGKGTEVKLDAKENLVWYTAFADPST
ncbi:mannose-6-phosphate isomerase [Myriangium duriaei CBS 260.36]|uniref:Mannose-6-phosphate isomerase n=1 Tax=Myriangium duriaei CBS 260.36 TaxID=1168546 RepID=A0A9P4J2L1_9PEZI|nr:mannose-6-phosphate isomerase [Myriangium duriaei CBS 260.36]